MLKRSGLSVWASVAVEHRAGRCSWRGVCCAHLWRGGCEACKTLPDWRADGQLGTPAINHRAAGRARGAGLP